MKNVLTILTIAIIVSSPCMAVHFDGGAGAGNPNWNAALNWSDDNIPTSATDVQALIVPGYGVVVNNPGAQAKYIDVGTWGWDGSLAVASAGTLSIAENLFLAQDAGKTGIATNDGQATVTGTVYFQAGEGTLINNGTLTAGGMILGNIYSGTSTVVNTGTMDIDGWMYLSINGSNSVFNMNSGVVNVTGKLEMPDPGIGHINLHGGVWTNAQIGLNGNGGYTIEVGDGEMYIAGDQTGALDYMISVDLITGEGSLTPYSSYDGTYTKLAAIPEPAIIGLISILGLALLRRK
ncbi:MAG: hypothetical protein DRI44_08285 [Chlamydiae bacterium]|nr:MAG: hypothetical protein DRI44_08285 [Chlamydiota bacterium]